MIEAQNRYDMLVANGGSRKEKSAALEALQKEQAEALKEEEKQLLEDAQKAYEEYEAEHPSAEDVDNASGANGRMDL